MLEGILRRQSRDIAKHRAEEQRASIENPAVPLTGENLAALFQGPETNAGTRISEGNALSIVAVLAAVKIIAESIATLPLITYRRRAERGKDRAVTHPLYELLHDQPNPEQTAVDFRSMLQAHLLVWGSGYAEIEMNQAGGVVALWPLLPDRTTVRRVNGQRVYMTTLPTGEPVHIPTDRMFHIQGLSHDGLRAHLPIQLARESLGLAKAAEEFGARFFGQGATSSGILEHPGKLGVEAAANLRASMQARQGGLSNAHRMMILEEGMKWNAMSVPPDAAQFLETRKFQVTEIARIFRVPPHMLADLERATFSNIEQQSIEFVTHCLRPWMVRWEQTIRRDLIGERERKNIFAEHLVDGLLRGDIQARYNAYQVARQNGWLSANDIRELENMNPIDGGDVYLVNGNMITADAASQAKPNQAPAPAPDPAANSLPARASYAGLFRDIGDRMAKREIAQLRKSLKQGEAAWSQSVEAVYREHGETMARASVPVFDAILSFGPPEARALVRTSRALAEELTGKELSESRKALDGAGFAGAEALLTEWERSRAASFADRGSEFIEGLLQTKPNVRAA